MILTEEGGDLVFNGGQPVMDKGLENASMISTHSNRGWWGNILMRKASQKMNSQLEEVGKRAVTVENLNDIRSAILASHQWFLDDGVAEEVDCVITNPKSSRVDYALMIKPPIGDPLIVVGKRYGQNWIAQKLDPASRRVESGEI